jgi:hypothetical protein
MLIVLVNYVPEDTLPKYCWKHNGILYNPSQFISCEVYINVQMKNVVEDGKASNEM